MTYCNTLVTMQIYKTLLVLTAQIEQAWATFWCAAVPAAVN